MSQHSHKIEGPTKQHLQGSRIQGVRVFRRIEIVFLPSWRKPRKSTNKRKQQIQTFLFLKAVKKASGQIVSLSPWRKHRKTN